jgi:hypothetical protein
LIFCAALTTEQVWAVFGSLIRGAIGDENGGQLYQRMRENVARRPGRYPAVNTVVCGALVRR